MRYRKGELLTKKEVLAAIDKDVLVFVVYTEPDPLDKHHSMRGVGYLKREDGSVNLHNAPNATPKVQDILAFEDLPIPSKAPYKSNDGVFTDLMGNEFAFYKAIS
jgi:hypothetical protein